MKIAHVHRISTIQKMKGNSNYSPAKKGNLESAQKLVREIICKYSLFEKLQGFICPVLKPAGNRIPLAFAQLISSNSNGVLYDAVYLQHTPHGSSMVERLYYEPVFFGPVKPGNYIIVDDVYTTGQTLRRLKHYIESKGGNVTGAWCIGSGPSLAFEPTRLLLKLLLVKHPDITKYFEVELLTVPQIQYLLRLSSINRLWHIHSDNQLKLLWA
jgi:hypothetical protein